MLGSLFLKILMVCVKGHQHLNRKSAQKNPKVTEPGFKTVSKAALREMFKIFANLSHSSYN